jgi:hypothetical protein
MEISAETINSIPFWLENKFNLYEVATGPISGTYGDVYLMENGPNSFAVKTLKAGVIENAINSADIEKMCSGAAPISTKHICRQLGIR